MTKYEVLHNVGITSPSKAVTVIIIIISLSAEGRFTSSLVGMIHNKDWYSHSFAYMQLCTLNQTFSLMRRPPAHCWVREPGRPSSQPLWDPPEAVRVQSTQVHPSPDPDITAWISLSFPPHCKDTSTRSYTCMHVELVYIVFLHIGQLTKSWPVTRREEAQPMNPVSGLSQ